MILLTSTGESIFQLIIILVIFAGVLFAAYYVTRWIAGYQKATQFNRNLEIVEAIKLTTNKYVQIVRVGEDKYYVIALGKDEITLLGELSSEELKEPSADVVNSEGGLSAQIDFKDILDKLSKKNKN